MIIARHARIVVAVAVLWSAGAFAQTIYRCGNEYTACRVRLARRSMSATRARPPSAPRRVAWSPRNSGSVPRWSAIVGAPKPS